MEVLKGFPERLRGGIQAFFRVMDPSDNSTGGGAASALAGAMAASLVGMAARISRRAKEPDEREMFTQLATKAEELALRLLEGARRDAEAFDRVLEAYKMPRTTEMERALRAEAIQEALKLAATVPLENARMCSEVMDLCRGLELRVDPKASSDLTCAKYLGEAAIKGCLENLAINLRDMKDSILSSRLREEGLRLAERIEGLKLQGTPHQ